MSQAYPCEQLRESQRKICKKEPNLQEKKAKSPSIKIQIEGKVL